MKRLISCRLFLLCAAMIVTTPGFSAQSCSASGGEPQRKSPTCTSVSVSATLIGLSEYSNPSVPAKKYRVETIGGGQYGCRYRNNGVSCTTPGGNGGFGVTFSGSLEYSKTSGAPTNNRVQFYHDTDGTDCGLGAPYPAGFVGGYPYEAWFEIPSTISQKSRSWDWNQLSPCSVETGWTTLSGVTTADLTVEDTEQDAIDRATKIPGGSNTAFRTKRTTGFDFSFCNVEYAATFDTTGFCSGDYDVHLVFTVKPHGSSGPVTGKTVITQQKLNPGLNKVSGKVEITSDSKDYELDKDYTLVAIELHAPCSDKPPSFLDAKIGSVSLGLSLGRGLAGMSAGEIRLDSATMTGALYSTAALTPSTIKGGGVEIVRDSGDALRQLKAPQTFADIVTLDASSYEVRFYELADVGLQDPGTKIYAITGTPLATYKFENPDVALSLTERLRLSEVRGSNTRVSEYAYDSSTSTWTLSRGNGLRHETLLVTPVWSDTTKTSTIRDASNTVVSKTTKLYRGYPWGTELLIEILDPAGAALTTNYVFYDDAGGDGGNYGHLKQRTNPDGSWETHAYDSSGRLTKTVRPYIDADITAAESLCRVTDYSYTTVADVDGDSTVEQLTTTIESILGQEISRSYRLEWSAAVTLGGVDYTRRAEIRCVAVGEAWNASANLVTDILTYTTDPFKGRERRVLNADGTVVLTAYSIDSGGELTTTVKTGQPNGTFDDIVAGHRTVAITSAEGQLTSESTTDIASGLTLTAWTATTFDSLGRPTRLDYSDGTYETKDYACCGLSSWRDRFGVTTSYSYDDLGRQTDIVRDGLTIRTAYDADGRVKSVTRIGSDTTEIVQTSNDYDLAGRLTERRDALNRATGFAEVYDSGTGQTTRTTTNPDTGTIIEVSARDGSRLSIAGTAAAPHTYNYGVESGLLFTKDVLVGPSEATTEWVKSYTDFAGRSFKTVYADSATAQSYFNTLGQLVRQVDPDGVTTLFGYNALGEQDTTAIDLDGDNVIDLAGTDRVIKTTRDVASHGAYVVQRTTTQAYETDNLGTATTVSVNESATDGLHSWQTVHGLTTSSVATLDGSGGRTVVTTVPDTTVITQVYSGDRVLSAVTSNPSLSTLASVAYAYDAQGRLETATDARTGVTTYSYYADDQIHTIVTPDPDASRSGAGYDPQTTTYTYNSAGRVDTVTQPDSTVVNSTYYLTGALKRTWGSRNYPTEYTYDPQGRVKTLTTWQDFTGNTGQAVTTWNYTSDRGFLQNKRYADSSGPDYTYHPSGRLLTRAWARTPVITTTYSYTVAGDLEEIDYSDSTPDVGMTYDRQGRPKTSTDASGSRTLTYDAFGQLQDEDYTAGLMNTLGVHRTYDAQFRLSGVTALSASTPVSQVTYGYDAVSRLDTVTQDTHTATYGYVSNAPLVHTVTFKTSGTTRLTTTKTYDLLNRLSSISSAPSTGTALSSAYTYNAANQRTKATRENNHYWNYDYDALGQVTAGVKFDASDAALPGHDYAWTYDDIGNRKTAVVNSQSATYTPNSLNEYTQRTVPGVVDVLGAAASAATVTVALNSGTPQATTRNGELFFKQLAVNNTSAAQNPSITITGVLNDAGPGGEDVVSEVTKTAFVPQATENFTHDADGNLTDDARWHYTWDAENRLIAMETATGAFTPTGPLPASERRKLEFTYDGQGRRVQKKVYAWNTSPGTWNLESATLFVYDGWNLIAELNALSSNAVVRTYAWGLDLSGSLQGAGGVGGLVFSNLESELTTHASAYDGNGNVIGLVDMATGVKSTTYDYNAFGETIQSDGVASVANHFRFSTKYTDDETGLLYYGFRFYQPTTGRWLSRDPIEENGGENLYAFVGNRPISVFDPLGLACVNFSTTFNATFDGQKLPKIPLGLSGANIEIGFSASVKVGLKGTKCDVCCGDTKAYTYTAAASIEGQYTVNAFVGWKEKVPDYGYGLSAEVWGGAKGSAGGQISLSDNYTWGGCKGTKFDIRIKTSTAVQLTVGGQAKMTWKGIDHAVGEISGTGKLEGFEKYITLTECDETGCHGAIKVSNGDMGRASGNFKFCAFGGCIEKPWGQ